MGYFRHKLDRARCRAQSASARLRKSHALVAAGVVLRQPHTEAAPPTRYRRYAVKGIDPDSQHQRGIFIAAGELKRSGELWDEEYQRLSRALAWFNTNLIVPRGVPPKAIFWFKPAASDCQRHAYEIVRLLRLYGYTVWAIEARRPGRVVYEDDLQVAALPFAAKEWEWGEPCWPWMEATGALAAAGSRS